MLTAMMWFVIHAMPCKRKLFFILLVCIPLSAVPPAYCIPTPTTLAIKYVYKLYSQLLWLIGRLFPAYGAKRLKPSAYSMLSFVQMRAWKARCLAKWT